jgi:hypothetical protein
VLCRFADEANPTSSICRLRPDGERFHNTAKEIGHLNGRNPLLRLRITSQPILMPLNRFRRAPMAATQPEDLASHQFRRHPIDARHIVVKNGLLGAIIPFDRYARPVRFNDGAAILWISIPRDALTNI